MWRPRCATRGRVGGSGELSAADNVGCLDHDGVAEHLVANHDRRQHQRVGVPGARIAEPVDRQRGVESWARPVAEQRLVASARITRSSLV